MRRLPNSILPCGDVAVTKPAGPAAIAHRLAYYPARDERKIRPARAWGTWSHLEPKPRCMSNITAAECGPFAEHSAGWADKFGAQACPTCFPEGD